MYEIRDYYTILGVPRNAPEAEVRRAFRTLAKELHPDSQGVGANPDAAYEFSLLTEAYETLKDPSRRKAYDVELNSMRQLASGGGRNRSPRSFAAGLGIGLVFAVALLGGKIYLDRMNPGAGAPKNQESLQTRKSVANPLTGSAQPTHDSTENPSAAETNGAAETESSASNRIMVPVQSSQTAHATAHDVFPTATAADQADAADSTGSKRAVSSEVSQTSAFNKAPAGARPSFADAVQTLERSLSADGGNASYHLVALVNSSNDINDLTVAAARAESPETRDLILKRIEALKEERKRATAQEKSARASAADQMIEFAAGPKYKQTTLKLRPGNGLSESFADCEECPEMVVVPAGQAFIGTRPENEGFRAEEAPAHKVSLHKALAVSKFWVSAENWRACVDAGACRPTLSSFLAIGRHISATRVSWFDAKDYVEWLSQTTGRRYRLLTEAEWEYAARAPGFRIADASRTFGSDTENRTNAGALRIGSGLRGLGPSKPNAWGLHGMPGGLSEWVEDCWHRDYNDAPADGSAWLSNSGGDCAYRVVRGVSGKIEFGGRKVTARAREFADARSPALGFRVAREIPPPAKTAAELTVGSPRVPRSD
ncbi:MAG: SUMF1/EgtB/PvdO family nonheme iron enzyme [Rhodomicrobium sp.]